MKDIGVDNVFKRTDLVKEWNLKKFGFENPQQNAEINKKTFETRKAKYELQGAIPRYRSEETCLEKYGHTTFFGSNPGKMSVNNLRETYGWNDEDLHELLKKRCWGGRYGQASKESLKLFVPLYKWLRRRGFKRSDMLFGIKGSREFSIFTEKKIFYYDFVITPLNIAIEFNGIGFHARNEFDILIRESAAEMIKKDLLKKQAIENYGFDLLVVWSDEPDSFNTCKQFIIDKEQR